MEFDNSFEVALPVDEAWKLLMDITRIAPCLPGAELTQVVDDRTYKGKVGVRLGPVSLAFAGTVKFDEIDDAAHRAKISAQGSDSKGRGAANATATFHLEPVTGGSKVFVHTNLTLSGAVAQYGRGVGIIQMTAAQIITQFANNLKAQFAPAAAAARAERSGTGACASGERIRRARRPRRPRPSHHLRRPPRRNRFPASRWQALCSSLGSNDCSAADRFTRVVARLLPPRDPEEGMARPCFTCSGIGRGSSPALPESGRENRLVLPPGRINRLADEHRRICAGTRLELLESPGIDLGDVEVAFLVGRHAVHAP